MSRWHNDNTNNERIYRTIVDRNSDQVGDLPFSTADRRIWSSSCPCDHAIDFYMHKTADGTLERWSIEEDGDSTLSWDAATYFDYLTATSVRSVAGIQDGDEHVYIMQTAIPATPSGTEKAIRAINGVDGSETWSVTLDDIKTAFSWSSFTNVSIELLPPRNGGGCFMLARQAGSSKLAIVDSAGMISKVTAVPANHPLLLGSNPRWPHPGGYVAKYQHPTLDWFIHFIDEGAGGLSDLSSIAVDSLSRAVADVNGNIYIAFPGVGGSVNKYDENLVENTAENWPLDGASFDTDSPPDLLTLPVSFGSTLVPETLADGGGGNTPFIIVNHNNGSGATIRANLHSSFGTHLWLAHSLGRDISSAEPYQNFGTDVIHRNLSLYTRLNDTGVPCAIVTGTVSGRSVVLPCGHSCVLD